MTMVVVAVVVIVARAHVGAGTDRRAGGCSDGITNRGTFRTVGHGAADRSTRIGENASAASVAVAKIALRMSCLQYRLVASKRFAQGVVP